MKITIESTNEAVTRDGDTARVWIGTTSTGVSVHCCVSLIWPQTRDPAALAIFEADLTEFDIPFPESKTIPLRFFV